LDSRARVIPKQVEKEAPKMTEEPLWRMFLPKIVKHKPKSFIVENVLGLLQLFPKQFN
jgi:hypothetical protein